MEDWTIDPILTDIHDLLYRLGVKATTQGFFETSCAVFLVMQRPEGSWFSIMELYQKISMIYRTELPDVDPRIRRVVALIWKRNPGLLSRLAGRELQEHPTPRRFIEIMRRYLFARKRRRGSPE